MTERNKELTAAQMLLDARTSGRRKREISTISRLLCIREEYLVALENGKYNTIPEIVYVLGFARNYAMELGLDPDEIVEKIKKEMGIENEFESDSDIDSDETIGSNNVIDNKKLQNQVGWAFERTSKFIYKHWKWMVSSLVALIILIFGISFVASLGRQSQDYNGTDTESVVKEPEYKMAVREKFGTENSSTANVIIQANQEAWVKIEDARGNTVFSRVLVAGDVYYVPAGDKYKGTFGNSGGLDVWVNGKLAPKLGTINTRRSGVIMTPDVLIPTVAAPVPDATADTEQE